MIPSADRQGFRFVFSRISWLESLLLGARTQARRAAQKTLRGLSRPGMTQFWMVP
jgi:hypothetical protein